ncbi:MAG: ferritin [Chloroflexi bacterium]|nr:ferritin [Chloroflexota bacterium]
MGYNEQVAALTPQTRSLSRALNSLVEELQAIDWYQQRVDTVEDEELRQLLAHNRDEEKEHAALLIEWLRRRDEAFGRELKKCLFTNGNLAELG